MKLGIAHPPFITSPVSYFSQDYASGVNSVNVKNNNEFAVNKYICLGAIGFQQSELIVINSVTGSQAIGLGSNTNFSHNGDDKVTQFDFNQIKVYKSTTGINGTYVLDQTINIDVADDFTIYEDINSQSTYYYKTSYFNSASNVEGSLSDAIAATGFVLYSLKTMTDRVLSAFGDALGKFVTRSEVQDYLNEFYEETQQEFAIITKTQTIKTQIITVQNNVESYSLNSDFLMEKAVTVSQNNGSTFPFRALRKQVDSIGHVYQTNVLYAYWTDGANIYLDPLPLNSSDQLKIYYVPTPSILSLQTDTLIAPFQNASRFMVKYALGMCYLKNKKFDEWKLLTGYAEKSRDKFISFYKRLQNRHPSTTEIVDDVYLR